MFFSPCLLFSEYPDLNKGNSALSLPFSATGYDNSIINVKYFVKWKKLIIAGLNLEIVKTDVNADPHIKSSAGIVFGLYSFPLEYGPFAFYIGPTLGLVLSSDYQKNVRDEKWRALSLLAKAGMDWWIMDKVSLGVAYNFGFVYSWGKSGNLEPRGFKFGFIGANNSQFDLSIWFK